VPGRREFLAIQNSGIEATATFSHTSYMQTRSPSAGSAYWGGAGGETQDTVAGGGYLDGDGVEAGGYDTGQANEGDGEEDGWCCTVM